MEHDSVDISADTLHKMMIEIEGPRYRNPRNEEAIQHIEYVEDYILTWFEDIGYTTYIQEVSFQSFETDWGRVFHDFDGKNLIGIKPGTTQQVLIIATHHDTVVDSPGADDNGTGIIGLLKLAEKCRNYDNRLTLAFISFDYEETGLVGSEWFVSRLEEEDFDGQLVKENIVGVIMLEMLGYYSQDVGSQILPAGFSLLYWREVKKLKNDDGELVGDFLTMVYNNTSKFIVNSSQKVHEGNIKIAYIRDAKDLPLVGPILERFVPSLQNLLRSDHTPFWLRDIPAVMITDTANFRNPHYHKRSDTMDTIDFTYLSKAIDHLFKLITQIDKLKVT